MNTAKDEKLVADGLVSIDEAMTFLSVGRSTLYELMERGLLSYAKIGRCRRIPKKALIDFAAAHLRGGISNEDGDEEMQGRKGGLEVNDRKQRASEDAASDE